jgi:RecB family endonuclease NucS
MEVIKRRYYDVSEMVRQVLGEAPIVPKEICREVAEESDDEMEDAFSFSFTMEEQLKNSLSKNLDQLEEGLRLYSTEFAIPKGRIDILAIDKDENFVVIETKLGLANDITQILSYINQIKQDIAKGKKVRGIIIASSFSERIKLAIGENPIKLKRYKVNFSFEDVL